MAKQFAIISLKKSTSPAFDPNISADDIDYSVPASVRGINMLLAKYKGQAYKSEVIIHSSAGFEVPHLRKRLSEAKIAFITDGGLVPKGNPDNLTPTNAAKFCVYSLKGVETLRAENYEISHQGYDNTFVLEDPNRLLPVDAMRELEREGVIGGILDRFYTTAGVMTSVENSACFGKQIAAALKAENVDAAILTSTCGTSTRCGAYIVKEIEQAGIPVVHVTNLTKIAEGIGSSRVLCGNNVCHVFGNPSLNRTEEYAYRKNLVKKALNLLESEPEENSSLVVS